MDGIEVLRVLRERGINVPVIIQTVHQEEAFFNRALQLGAQGHLLKDSAIADIAHGIRAVAAVQNYVSPLLTSYLFKQKQSASRHNPSTLEQLTPAERQVLKLIADTRPTNR
jgi:two-component system, NarL family, nitrate/nitrite response regulator NarL